MEGQRLFFWLFLLWAPPILTSYDFFNDPEENTEGDRGFLFNQDYFLPKEIHKAPPVFISLCNLAILGTSFGIFTSAILYCKIMFTKKPRIQPVNPQQEQTKIKAFRRDIMEMASVLSTRNKKGSADQGTDPLLQRKYSSMSPVGKTDSPGTSWGTSPPQIPPSTAGHQPVPPPQSFEPGPIITTKRRGTSSPVTKRKDKDSMSPVEVCPVPESKGTSMPKGPIVSDVNPGTPSSQQPKSILKRQSI